MRPQQPDAGPGGDGGGGDGGGGGLGAIVAGPAEQQLFSDYLTAAIDRDRAERLGEMIKTTGYQLNETYNRNKQFFN